MIFYNPHIDDFLAKPPHYPILKRRALKKYGFLIDEEINAHGKIRVLVDGQLSAFFPGFIFSRLHSRIRCLISAGEFALWRKLNQFPKSAIEYISLEDEHLNDTIIAFSYKAACGDFSGRLKIFKNFIY